MNAEETVDQSGMTAVVDREMEALTREEDAKLRRFLGLAHANSLEEYLHSADWAKSCDNYRRTSLLQACLLCGRKPFKLQHTTYAHLGAERPEELVPLCDDHYHRLHQRLEGDEVVSSPKVLRALCFLASRQVDERAFQRRLLPYRKALLTYVAALAGLEYQMVPYHVGGKEKHRKDKKLIKLRDSAGLVRNVYFDAARGTVQVWRRGGVMPFEHFCFRIGHYVAMAGDQ